jgi:hypothetical protein
VFVGISTFLRCKYVDKLLENGPNVLVVEVDIEKLTVLIPSLGPHHYRTSHMSWHSIVPDNNAFPNEGLRSILLV